MPAGRLWVGLAGLALALLACNTLQRAVPTAPVPAPTASPASLAAAPSSLTPPPRPSAMLQPAAGLSASPNPQAGVRACAYIPGQSVPAEMAPASLATPTAVPTPTPPSAAAVDPEDSARQLRIFQELWDRVDQTYVYEGYNGRDWPAIGERYRAFIAAGLSEDDFYDLMDAMLAELGEGHSYFESPSQARDTDDQFKGNNDYVGVGVLVSPVPEANRGVIVMAFPGGPAAEAGLGPHDSILAVDGEPVLDQGGWITRRIRGPAGTPVTLTVQRPGDLPFDLTLIRRRITGNMPIDSCLIPGTRIGYVFLPSLDDETIPGQVRAALLAFAEAGLLEGLILDNRQNSGGLLTVLEEVLSFFADGAAGDFIGRRSSRPLTISGVDVAGSQDLALVVLVDVDTVSFGEVLSGVLQAVDGAQVVGQTTLGNVETLWAFEFEDGSRAWIASESFQPVGQPNGIWEETGIVPDVVVPTRWDLFTEATDPALAVAVELLSGR